jgi:hypothetical protein
MLQWCTNYCKRYEDDPNVVYKSCGDHIVVLKKLADTITNESRDNVKDRRYAKFRANKLEVLCIFQKNNPREQLETINDTFYREKKLTYTVGKIVCVDDYDVYLNKIYASGIHYFKSVIAAFYYKLNVDLIHYTGFYMSWHDNGSKYKHCNYVDGRQCGKCSIWKENCKRFIKN